MAVHLHYQKLEEVHIKVKKSKKKMLKHIDKRFIEVEDRLDGLVGRFAILEEQMDEKFAIFVKRMDERFSIFEKQLEKISPRRRYRC